MKNILIAAFLFVLLVNCSNKNSLESLKIQIESELGKQDGVFAVALKDLQTGEELLINSREKFHAASTMKTPVMVEVFKQATEGKFLLNDSIVLRNEFKSIFDGSTFSIGDDSDTVSYKELGKKKTIYTLMYDMIIVSSNLATNHIIELVDAKNVTQTMRSIGANDIQVLRGVEDIKAYDAGMNNQVTAYDLMLLFEKIAKEEMVSAEASQNMIRILMDQQFNEIIPAQLPNDIKVAHKTGSITGVQHDSGIVYFQDGRKYVLVLLSKNLSDPDAAIASMAKVSKQIFEYVSALP